jgi:hypothetical protein
LIVIHGFPVSALFQFVAVTFGTEAGFPIDAGVVFENRNVSCVFG